MTAIDGSSENRPKGRRAKALRSITALVGAKKKDHSSFNDLGWTFETIEGGVVEQALDVLALDLGLEAVCLTGFGKDMASPSSETHPTAVVVEDSHAFRTLEAFSLSFGLPALERWPSERVLRGTFGGIQLPSQIGLVTFPADHCLAGLIEKIRSERQKQARQVILTLPTFMPRDRNAAIRQASLPLRQGCFVGVPGALAAAYFYLAPGRVPGTRGDLARWSRDSLRDGRVLILDWGASGLEYGLVTIREGNGEEAKTQLRLEIAGTWPGLGGYRLTRRIYRDLKRMLVERLLEAGPSDFLVERPLFRPGSGHVPRPLGYADAFRRLERIGKPSNDGEEAEWHALSNIILPTAWRFRPGEEPQGYAPYRRLAILHFRALWRAAERIKRRILMNPDKTRRSRTISWNSEQLDSPFTADLDRPTIEFPVRDFLRPVERAVTDFVLHLDGRLKRGGVTGLLNVGVCGRQAGSPVLQRAIEGIGAKMAPSSNSAIELKSVINRGATLIYRDRRRLDWGVTPEVLPFSVQIADCLGNITIFDAGPLDELAVFQRRIRVEEGFPQFEFFVFESEDGTESGPWGCIEFEKPFDFTERDRTIAVDPRYGFRGDIPRLRDLKGDEGQGLTDCFDRETPGQYKGEISFRDYAPSTDVAQRLLHFLEFGLKSKFHSKVFLLEREFREPPRRFDYVYQRYYLSYSQELLVVREWWAPGEGGKLKRQKYLYTCQGAREANNLLGLHWGFD